MGYYVYGTGLVLSTDIFKTVSIQSYSCSCLMCYVHNTSWLHVCCIFRSKFFRSKYLLISLAFCHENKSFQHRREHKFDMITALDGNYSSKNSTIKITYNNPCSIKSFVICPLLSGEVFYRVLILEMSPTKVIP